MRPKVPVAALLVVAGCARGESDTEPPPATSAKAQTAEEKYEFTLPEGLVGIDGPGLLDEIRRGTAKAALVAVWASWCGSCQAEMPLMVQIRERYRARGIDVLFVSVDEPLKAADAVTFIERYALPRPSYFVLGPLAPFKQTMSPLWPGSLPATFLFDATGKLRYFWGAQVYEQELVEVLDGFLAGRPIDGVANPMIRYAPPAR